MLRPVSGLSHTNSLPGPKCLSGIVLGFLFLIATLITLPDPADAQSSVRPPASASSDASGSAATSGDTGNLSNALGTTSDSDFWRKLREGQEGSTQIKAPAAGQAMRAPGQRLRNEQQIRDAVAGGGALSRVTSPNLSGDGWRSVRNNILPQLGGYVIGGMLLLLALFFLLRGKIRVEHGLSGYTVTRFMTIERVAHWLMAVSFIILGISGLLITYGNSLLSTGVVSKSLFATLAIWGKFLHNYVAFAFMVGLAMAMVMWLKHNLPSRTDFVWILKGGGMFTKGTHPPAKKFNFGQKIIFWLVMLGGISISMSGIALMFPYQTAMFAKTFALLNAFGFDLQTNLTLVQEQQLASLWHAVMGIFLIAVIIAHIYIGTVGMEGAYDAMGSGEVDVNWAKEHHSIWYEEVATKEQGRSNPTGADLPQRSNPTADHMRASSNRLVSNLLKGLAVAAAIIAATVGPATADTDAEAEAEARVAGNLVGHGGPVKTVRVSPDGKSALSGSFDYSMIHWRLDVTETTGKAAIADTIRRRFDDHDGAVNAVAYLPDGKAAVAAGDDGSLTLWDLQTGNARHTFKGHTGKVLAVDVSADGAWATTASWDGTVRLWNLLSGTAGPVLKGHRGPVNGVVFAPDGEYLYSAGYDGQIGRWSRATGELDRMLYKHGWGLNVLNALPGGKQLAFGSLNGAVGIIDAETGERVHDLASYERPVLSMAVLPKPGLLATGGGDGVVRVYRLGDWKLLEEHRNPYGPVWAMDFGKQGQYLYYAGLDDFVTRWQISPRKPFEKITSQFPRRFQVSSEVSLGERQFARKCSVCHTLKKDGKNRAGPTLHKVFGRKIGTVPNYPYSEALANGDIVWTGETLRKLFTLGPEHYTPGTKMPLQKITDTKKIDALIAFLEVATDDAPGTSSAKQ